MKLKFKPNLKMITIGFSVFTIFALILLNMHSMYMEGKKQGYKEVQKILSDSLETEKKKFNEIKKQVFKNSLHQN